jgi:hypothetical protein
MCDCTSQTAIRRIKAYAALQGWSKGQLSVRAGFKDTTLRKLDHPNWNPTLRVIESIEAIIPADFCPEANKSQRASK